MESGRPQLKTERLVLSPMTAEELEEKSALERDAHLAAAYAEMAAGVRGDPKNASWHADWRMTRIEDGQTVGGAGFKGPPAGGTVEIGYGVEEAFQGNGYATETVAALCAWAFCEKSVDFVSAQAEEGNRASSRVLEKCGFVRTGMGNEGVLWELKRGAL